MPGPPVVKLDVSVRLAQLDALVAQVADVLAAAVPGAWAGCFGHALDGNLHVQLVGVDEASAERATGQVLRAVADLGGSISAEHGIGRTKARWLGLARSPDAISWMRDLKATVDPQGLLNPGVLFGP
ncbi:MAG TPA: FAD-linked oxidase C-terminal domain-containing protein, partial [Candidatus Nanopelagicales bacterium]